MAQHTGEAGKGTGVRAEGVGIPQAVGADHGTRISHHIFHVLFAHTEADLGGGKIVGHQHVQNGVHPALAVELCRLGHHHAAVLGIGLGSADHQPLVSLFGIPATQHGLCDGLAALGIGKLIQQFLPGQSQKGRGDLGHQAGGRGDKGVLIQKDGVALPVDLLDHGNGLPHLAPVIGAAAGLVMGNDASDAGLPDDAQGLFHRLHQPCALVAHMDGHIAAVFHNYLAQFNHFLGVGKGAGGIDHTEGDTQCTSLHGIPDVVLHALQLLGGGLAALKAHDGGTDGAVTDVEAHTGTEIFPQIVQIGLEIGAGGQIGVDAVGAKCHADAQAFVIILFRQGGGRMTAHTHDLGGDALLQLVGAGRDGLHDHVVVAVGVHKAGGQGQTLGVDDLFGLFRDNRGDDGNFALPDTHVRIVGRHAGAVHDACVLNQKIQHKMPSLR